MTIPVHILVIAVIEILMAGGIALFWFTWLRTDHDEPWLPAGFNEHERVFVYPDLTMCLLMITSAILLLNGFAAGRRLSLVCAGMMLFLAVIDTAYFIQHGLFSKEKNGWFHFSIVALFFAVSIFIATTFL